MLLGSSCDADGTEVTCETFGADGPFSGAQIISE